MARPLRIDHPGALWHITSRGNEQRLIFLDDDDRLVFLSLLAKLVGRFRWILHDYVLMGNHYHLVTEMVEANLSRGMQWLNGRYARYFNRRHQRWGHLFGGRFKSKLVDTDKHLFEVCRYTVLNPVRAGLVANAADWRWSSYRAKIGLEAPPEWLAIDPLLSRMAPTRERAQQLWREFVDTSEPIESPWGKLVAQIYLGDDSFLERVRARIEEKPRSREHPRAQREVGRPVMKTIIRTVARVHGVKTNAVRKGRGGEARMVAAYAGWQEGRLRLREIGEPLRLRSAGYVSTLIHRCEARAAVDRDFASLLARCREALGPQPPPVSKIGHFRSH